MVGKRIHREIKTIEKMIKIYEKAYPAPLESPDFYQKLLLNLVHNGILIFLKQVCICLKNLVYVIGD